MSAYRSETEKEVEQFDVEQFDKAIMQLIEDDRLVNEQERRTIKWFLMRNALRIKTELDKLFKL